MNVQLHPLKDQETLHPLVVPLEDPHVDLHHHVDPHQGAHPLEMVFPEILQGALLLGDRQGTVEGGHHPHLGVKCWTQNRQSIEVLVKNAIF